MKNEISIPAAPAEINGNGFRPRILRDRSMDCRSYDVDHACHENRVGGTRVKDLDCIVRFDGSGGIL
jgi:hypothetical protein